MRKLFSLLLLTTCCMYVFAQQSVKDIRKIKAHMTMADRYAYTGNEQQQSQFTPPHQISSRAIDTISIGWTTYDLQTNNSVCRRVVNFGNGKVACTWTQSFTFNISAPDRGTGYNYFDGTNWEFPAGQADPTQNGPMQRIENVRVGWPSIGVTRSGREFVITHTGGSGLNMAYRQAGSGGTWTNKLIPHDANNNPLDPQAVWPRVATAGDTIYVITSRSGSYFGGLLGGIAFSRSFDGGDTWIGPDSIPGLDSTNFPFISGDGYAIDANGSTVAFVCGFIVPTLFKSTDAGNTWTMKRLVQVSDPLFQGDPGQTLDSVVTGDESYSIIVDHNGMVHVWYGKNVIKDDDPNTEGWTYYPYDNGIMYWNESMGDNPPVQIPQTGNFDNPFIQDGDCFFGVVQGHNPQLYFPNHTSMPSAGIDAAGNLYLSYSALREDFADPNGMMYRGTFLIKSMDGGNTWIGPIRVNQDSETAPSEEAVYGSMAREVDSKVHLVYQSDDYAGVAVQNTQATGYNVNRQKYVAIDVNDIVNPPDSTCPTITGAAFDTTFTGGCPYNFDGVRAYDVPDGELNSQIQIVSGTLDLNTPGTYPVTIQVTDAAGNSSDPYNLTVVVIQDTEAPVIHLNGYSPIDIIVNTPYVDAGAYVTDNASCDLNDSLVVVNNVNTSAVGTYTVDYFVTDASGNSAQAQRIVNVIAQDVTPPVITLLGNNPYTFDACGGSYMEPGATAFDNVDLDVTSSIVTWNDIVDTVPGTYTVYYVATDNSGNSDTVTRTVIVADMLPPTITLNGTSTMYLCLGDTWTDPGATATDCIDDNVTVTVSGTVDNTSRGSYTLTYNAQDASGNSATPVTRTVVVNTEPDPDFDFTINGATVTFTDQSLYNPTSWTWDFGDGTQSTLQNPSHTYTQNGTYTVCLTVSSIFNDPSVCDETPKQICKDVMVSVGIEEVLAESFNIYPNPTAGIINIELKNNRYSALNVTVHNIVGKEVYRNDNISMIGSGNVQVDLSGNANGVYILHIGTTDGTLTKRITLNSELR